MVELLARALIAAAARVHAATEDGSGVAAAPNMVGGLVAAVTEFSRSGATQRSTLSSITAPFA